MSLMRGRPAFDYFRWAVRSSKWVHYKSFGREIPHIGHDAIRPNIEFVKQTKLPFKDQTKLIFL